MSVTLVAAVARNGVIGAGADIPWHLPGEQRRFKELTIGHVLVMGRLTYDSIGRPLPGRTTVVVTRQLDWQPSDGPHDSVHVAPSVLAALKLARELDEQVFVVGGGQVYAEALPHADRMVVTWVDAEPDGDVFYPEFDPDDWTSRPMEAHDDWSMVEYARKAPVTPAAAEK